MVTATPTGTVNRGTRVRWRHGRTWRHGVLLSTAPGVNDTLTARPERCTDAVTIRTGDVEHETTGPRGGRHWAPVIPRPQPEQRRKPRTPTPVAVVGQLVLFDQDHRP